MLEKHLYDSWKSRMELYMMNRPHGRMILASVEKGPLVWPSITKDGVTILKEYTELTPAEAIQADCDIKKGDDPLMLSSPDVRVDKLLLLWVLQGLTLQEQVEAILENRGRLFAITAKGKATCPDNAPNQREKRDDSWFKGKVLLYVIDSQQVNVQNSNSSAQQDDLIVSVIETKAQQSKPKLYVGDIIFQTNPIVIPDSEETLALAEESHSKMLSKHKDNMMLEKEKQVDTTPIDYVALNKDFSTRFVPQTELSTEQAFWSKNSLEPILSIRPTNVKVPKELPKVNMVNTSLKKLKYNLANSYVVITPRVLGLLTS
ncbi:hypothetical protein Tco_0812154, partial [Tanacetum coccineum]